MLSTQTKPSPAAMEQPRTWHRSIGNLAFTPSATSDERSSGDGALSEAVERHRKSLVQSVILLSPVRAALRTTAGAVLVTDGSGLQARTLVRLNNVEADPYKPQIGRILSV